MSKKLFKPFDVTLFFPQQGVQKTASQPQLAPPPPQPTRPPATPCQTPVSCFITAPPDESAGVTKVVPSPLRSSQTLTDPLLLLVAASEDNDGGEKKGKKEKKDKKKKRKATEDAEEGEGLLADLLFPSAVKSEEERKAEVIKFAAERGLTVTFTTHTVPTLPTATAAFRPYDVDMAYETYMAGPGNLVNAHVKSVYAQDLAAMPTDGKSLGDKKYGCVFCGSLHHLECYQKGNDPPCLSKGAFNRFIQNFLFEYDIAPDQEWRQMLQFKVPGHRRVMAERFASLVANTSDPEWMSIMHRRSWEMRKQTFSSNAGTSRELHHQGRVSEFLFFHAHGGSTSPRPSSALSVPQMGSMGSFGTYGGGVDAGSPVPPVDLSFPHAHMHNF
jgi:hypothetical protein